MSRTVFRFTWTLWLVFGLVLPVQARADETCPAATWVKVVELTRDAKALMDEQRFDEALARLRRAHDLCPEPKLRRSMARVYDEAGRSREALIEYRNCVQEGADEAVRAECERRAVEIEKTLLAAEAPPPGPEPGPAVPVPLPQPEPMAPVASEPVPANPAPVPVQTARAGAFAPGTAWNWVGIGMGAAALGVGVAFLVQYGVDRSNAQDRHWDPERQGWWAADEVGPRNLVLGVGLSVLGLAGGITSAVLWPKAPIRATVAPTTGGGVVGVAIDLR